MNKHFLNSIVVLVSFISLNLTLRLMYYSLNYLGADQANPRMYLIIFFISGIITSVIMGFSYVHERNKIKNIAGIIYTVIYTLCCVAYAKFLSII